MKRLYFNAVPLLLVFITAGCGFLEALPDEQLEVINQTEPGFTVLSKTGAENNWLEASYLGSNLHDVYSRYYRSGGNVSTDLVVTVLDKEGEPVANFKRSFNLNGWWTNQSGAFVVSVIMNKDYVYLAKGKEGEEDGEGLFSLSFPTLEK